MPMSKHLHITDIWFLLVPSHKNRTGIHQRTRHSRSRSAGTARDVIEKTLNISKRINTHQCASGAINVMLTNIITGTNTVIQIDKKLIFYILSLLFIIFKRY